MWDSPTRGWRLWTLPRQRCRCRNLSVVAGRPQTRRQEKSRCRRSECFLPTGANERKMFHTGRAIRNSASQFASVDDSRNIASSSPCFPRLTVTDDRVEDRQQFPHAGGQGDFGRTTRLAQAQIHPADHRIDASGYQSGHVERRADGGAATTNNTTPPHGAAVAVHRRHTDQGRKPPAVECPEFGEFGQQGAGNGASNTRDGTEQLLVSGPGRTFFDGRAEILLDRGESLL